MPARSVLLISIALAPAWSRPGDSLLCNSESVSQAVELYVGGDIEGSEKMLRAEWQAREGTGPMDGCQATILNNLAAASQTLGRFAEAETLYRRVIAFWRETPGDEVLLARTLNNLASLYVDRRDEAKADRLELPAQVARLEVSLPGHPDLATLLATVAVIDTLRGRYAEAEGRFLQSLRIWRALGPDGREAMQALNNLAILYRRTGRREAALAASARALEIGEATLSPDHPSWVLLYSAVAQLSPPAEAVSHYRRALGIAEVKLGPEHPVVGRLLLPYARTLRTLKRGREAKACEDRARVILDSAFPNRRHTVSAADLIDGKR